MKRKLGVRTAAPLSALVILGLTVTSPSAALAVSEAEQPDDSAIQPPEPESLENLKLVEGLGKQDECLFRNSVYPAGGVGFRDSSLP